MALLENKDWKSVNVQPRVLAKGLLECTVGDVREEPTNDKNGPGESLVIPLILEKPWKTVDEEPVGAGFPLTARLRVYSSGDLPDNLKKANEISEQRIKQFMLAALGLKRSSKEDPAVLVKQLGGWAGLQGRHVLVNVGVSDQNGTKFQEFQAFSANLG